jgi:hypothetical protein
VPSPWEMKATATLLPEKKKNTTRSKRHATSCFLCRAAHPPAAAAGRKLQERRRRHRHVISAAVAANGHAATTRSSAGRAVGSSRRSRCSAATGPAKALAGDNAPAKAVAVVHACGICGMGFSTGQALLGGHMRRRHRGPTTAEHTTAYVGPTQIIVHLVLPILCCFSTCFCRSYILLNKLSCLQLDMLT